MNNLAVVVGLALAVVLAVAVAQAIERACRDSTAREAAVVLAKMFGVFALLLLSLYPPLGWVIFACAMLALLVAEERGK